MANKPRMGSDPFQKKDPLGWIGSDQSEKTGQEASAASPQSNPGKLSKAGKPGVPSNQGNQSKHELPSPPSTPEHPGTPSGPPRGATTSKGLRPGWTRATFIVKEETVQRLKAVAYWDRKELKRVVEEAFRAYLEDREVKPIPPLGEPTEKQQRACADLAADVSHPVGELDTKTGESHPWTHHSRQGETTS